MDCHQVNFMNKCNVPNKKILAVVSSNQFSQETAVLRKIVVQAKALPLVIHCPFHSCNLLYSACV